MYISAGIIIIVASISAFYLLSRRGNADKWYKSITYERLRRNPIHGYAPSPFDYMYSNYDRVAWWIRLIGLIAGVVAVIYGFYNILLKY
jgi:uncharacterized membrane protein